MEMASLGLQLWLQHAVVMARSIQTNHAEKLTLLRIPSIIFTA